MARFLEETKKRTVKGEEMNGNDERGLYGTYKHLEVLKRGPWAVNLPYLPDTGGHGSPRMHPPMYTTRSRVRGPGSESESQQPGKLARPKFYNIPAGRALRNACNGRLEGQPRSESLQGLVICGKSSLKP